MATHRRDETLLVGRLGGCQQRIGEALLGNFILDDIARFQTAYLHHDLTRTPIDGTCRSGIVARLRHVQVQHITIGPVNGHIPELRMSGQRIVIILDDTVVHGSTRCLHLELPIDPKRTGSRGLHGHGSTVQQIHAIEADILLFDFRGRILRIPVASFGLSEGSRTGQPGKRHD